MNILKEFNIFILHVIFKRPIKTRDDLPFLLNILKLTGSNSRGVEIGTWKGDYSAHLLEFSKLSVLYSIDPWQHFPRYIYSDSSNVSQEDFNIVYDQALRVLRKFGKRSQIIKKISAEASKEISDNTLDFIYIDANHSYRACKEDINLWWPKLKKGGLFAGHDYLDGEIWDGKSCQGKINVKSAVNDFLKEYPHKLFVTPELWPTWYFVKE